MIIFVESAGVKNIKVHYKLKQRQNCHFKELVKFGSVPILKTTQVKDFSVITCKNLEKIDFFI